MWSQPGPEQTPDTFHGVDVNLVDAVSIKLLPTCQTAISLSGMLTLVPTLSGDLVQGYRKVERSSAPVQEPTGADSKNPDFIARRSSPEFAVNRILMASSTLRWPWALHAVGMPLDWNVLIVVLLKGCWASAREVS